LEHFFFVLLSEANAIARAQVKALGGNALLCHHTTLQDSSSRGKITKSGQSYNMLSIQGDAVLLEFDEKYSACYEHAVLQRKIEINASLV